MSTPALQSNGSIDLPFPTVRTEESLTAYARECMERAARTPYRNLCPYYSYEPLTFSPPGTLRSSCSFRPVPHVILKEAHLETPQMSIFGFGAAGKECQDDFFWELNEKFSALLLLDGHGRKGGTLVTKIGQQWKDILARNLTPNKPLGSLLATVATLQELGQRYHSSGTTLTLLVWPSDDLSGQGYGMTLGHSPLFKVEEGTATQLSFQLNWTKELLQERGIEHASRLQSGMLYRFPFAHGDATDLTCAIGDHCIPELRRHPYPFIVEPRTPLLLCSRGLLESRDPNTFANVLNHWLKGYPKEEHPARLLVSHAMWAHGDIVREGAKMPQTENRPDMTAVLFLPKN